MYCNQCNLEFPEGLRYCKWCGQELAKSRRVTSELRTCSACSAAIHPDWTFCKACGVRLVSTPPEPATAICSRCGAGNDPSALYCSVCGESLLLQVAPERAAPASQPGTAVIHHCESCGEHLEALTGYCKMCGAAVQPPAQPFGASSLLCGQCQSYSPIGSSACRVCGASLAGAGEGEEPEQARSSTLPDLADRIPNPEAVLTQMAPGADSEAALTETDLVKSGEQTAIFPMPETSAPPPAEKPVPPRSAFETVETRIPFLDLKPQGGAETGVLPGVAGASSDHVSTTHLNQSRTTGPVDPSEQDEQAPASAELSAPPADSPQASTQTEVIGRKPTATVEDKNATVESEVRLTQSIHGADESAATGFNTSMPTAAQGDGFTAPFGLNSSALERSWQDEEKTRNISQPETEALPAGSTPENKPAANKSAAKAENQSVKPTVEVPVPREPSKTESFYGDPYAQAPETAVLKDGFTPTRAVEAVPVETVYEPPPQKRDSLPIILSVIAGLILIGAAGLAVWWYTSPDPRTRSQAQPPAEPPPVTVPQAPAPAPTAATPSAPEGMVMVAAGTYTIGRDVKDNYESPAHSVTLPAFYIDRTEVTNSAYKKFVDATGHEPPGGWKDGTFPEGLDNHPVTGVSWQDAVDYATWAGKRLPTEEEWEAAARGSEGWLYPWGNEWKADLANIGTKSTREVGQFPGGASPSGALDMIGNVWEWTADEFHLYPGNTEEAPENIKQASLFRIIRGGAYDGSKLHTATYRGFVEADSRKYNKTGFRCARSAAGGGR
ncbi:MAG TPA: SUMF1/EgtB/PvdO family nonheme iron enzyme [Blastocatellia bacterium]|nr:SUMF1/EgtB/PvdO family nonheme iron enzyme [Blastocatellia bacterium]